MTGRKKFDYATACGVEPGWHFAPGDELTDMRGQRCKVLRVNPRVWESVNGKLWAVPSEYIKVKWRNARGIEWTSRERLQRVTAQRKRISGNAD